MESQQSVTRRGSADGKQAGNGSNADGLYELHV
jgi:hypothetical protein